MRMNISDQKFYPNLTSYVKNEIPKVAGIPKIANALLKNGEISKSSLRVVLRWNTIPLIKIVDFEKEKCGEFSPGIKSNEIRISLALVQKFELSRRDKKLTLLLGATILHELTHWGDDQDGKDIPGEEGNLFELDAYGYIIPCVLK